MLRNLVCSLFEHGHVVTTLPKAKELVVWLKNASPTLKKAMLHSPKLKINFLHYAKK